MSPAIRIFISICSLWFQLLPTAADAIRESTMSSRAFAHSSATLQSLSKEIGFDFSTLEKNGEAGRLWDALNDLANDPVAYNNFMAKQLQHLDSSKDGEVTLNEQSAESAMPPFVPLSGFVVKAFTKPDGDKVFVNISHTKLPYQNQWMIMAMQLQSRVKTL